MFTGGFRWISGSVSDSGPGSVSGSVSGADSWPGSGSGADLPSILRLVNKIGLRC